MSDLFSKVGIDLGVVVLLLIVLIIVMMIMTVSMSLRLSRLNQKYRSFMKGKDAQSLEKLFHQRFKEIDKLNKQNELTKKNLADLKKVGRPAVMMSFVPASFEICGYLLCAPMILGITRIEAAVMGAVLAAVSPAVVVPRMVQLMESGYGTEKSIPQMILAGASCDDIFVIVLFSTFSGMAQGGTADMKQFLNIPVSIVLGILLGAVVGYLLSLFFAWRGWQTCGPRR